MKHHEATGIDDGCGRLHEQPVDDAEHGDIGANAKRERQRDHRGETGTQTKSADGVAEVLKERVRRRGDDAGHTRHLHDPGAGRHSTVPNVVWLGRATRSAAR